MVKRSYDASRRRASARQTRRAILDAAAELFVEPGYAGARMADVAEAAGVAVPTIAAHFGSKKGLLSAVLDVTIAGDDEPVPMAGRSFVADINALPEARVALVRAGRRCALELPDEATVLEWDAVERYEPDGAGGAALVRADLHPADDGHAAFYRCLAEATVGQIWVQLPDGLTGAFEVRTAGRKILDPVLDPVAVRTEIAALRTRLDDPHLSDDGRAALRLLAMGVPLLVEKPLALDMPQARAMQARLRPVPHPTSSTVSPGWQSSPAISVSSLSWSTRRCAFAAGRGARCRNATPAVSPTR